MAKAELGLSTLPKHLKPTPPSPGSYSGSPSRANSFKLLSIDQVNNVNIIKRGEVLPFAKNGITVVYGDNGSGKSGYARILKLACQARDKDDIILPDVFSASPVGTPTARLKIEEKAKQTDIVWHGNKDPDPILTSITVFDSRCARVITDKQNSISYLPYGADVFRKTAEIVRKIKSDIESEIRDIVKIKDSAILEGTRAYEFLESISENTTAAELKTGISWSAEDDKELNAKEDLIKSSSTLKSETEITRMTKLKARIQRSSDGVQAISKLLSGITQERITQTYNELDAAQKAYDIAVNERQTPEPLPGVGVTDEWELLYKTAKSYSENIAYPDKDFPLLEDAYCVLCQQELGNDAVKRFGRFKRYMEDTTSVNLELKRKQFKALVDEVESILVLDETTIDSIGDDIESISSSQADLYRKFYKETKKNLGSLISRLKNEKSLAKFGVVPSWPVDFSASFATITTKIQDKIEEIKKSLKPEEKKLLVDRVNELKAQKALKDRKDDISSILTVYKQNAKLHKAANSLRVADISRHGTSVIKKNLSPALMKAFNDELTILGATRIPVSLKPKGREGETEHEVELVGATVSGRTRTSDILSEGETRVIAIAGFLSELELAPHSNAIVLDDPVSSLDHVFTAKIASRLAKEGLKRQVIIFTHNIAFLMELKDAASELALLGKPVDVTVNTLRRIGKLAGITIGGEPWYAQKLSSRLQYLDQLVHKHKHNYLNDKESYNKEVSYIYGLLRESWESCIEDELLNSIVVRSLLSRYRSHKFSWLRDCSSRYRESVCVSS